jgi:hypothetical protein
MFSRTLDTRHWTNAINIAEAIKKKTGKRPNTAKVHTYELYDKSFAFPRVRRFKYVNENMDMLEHFQDNLNTNINNSVAMRNFLRAATTVRSNFAKKYTEGKQWSDPGLVDPREAAAAEKTWASLG